MKYVNYASYTLDVEAVARVRPAHRKYAEALAASGKLIMAGPFVDRPGGLFIYEATSRSEALALMEKDPYAVEGVFTTCELSEWEIAGVNQDLLSRK
jgi:uncharacterized protein YciI